MNNKTFALVGLLVIGLLAAPGVSASSESSDADAGCLDTYLAEAQAAGSINEHRAAVNKFLTCVNFT